MFFDWWVDRLVRIEGKLDQVLNLQKQVLQKETLIMGAIEDAVTAAEEAARKNADAEDAVIGLLGALAQQISDLKSAGTDPATVQRIQALATALQQKADALGAAVVANTPAA